MRADIQVPGTLLSHHAVGIFSRQQCLREEVSLVEYDVGISCIFESFQVQKWHSKWRGQTDRKVPLVTPSCASPFSAPAWSGCNSQKETSPDTRRHAQLLASEGLVLKSQKGLESDGLRQILALGSTCVCFACPTSLSL